MVRYIYLMVDNARNLSDHLTSEQLFIFRAMVRDEGSLCLDYVHEVDRLQVPADYRRNEITPVDLCPPIYRRGKGGVTGRRACYVESGGVSCAFRDPNQARSNDHVLDCENGSTSEVHNENFSRASGSDDLLDDCNIGSTPRVTTYDFTQESNIAYQTPDTQIIPLMTPEHQENPQYSMDSTFENEYGHFGTDFFAGAPPHFRGSLLPLSVNILDAHMNDGDGGLLEDVLTMKMVTMIWKISTTMEMVTMEELLHKLMRGQSA